MPNSLLTPPFTRRRVLAMALLLGPALACAPKAVQVREEDPLPRAARPRAAPPSAATGEAAPPTDQPSPVAVAVRLFFELDSAQLRPQSLEDLAAAAELLRGEPKLTVKIEGHTCELGTTEYNLALGMRRAQATRAYLLRLGVPESRVDVISYGEEQPSLAGAGDAVWTQNRRAELQFGGGR